MGIIFTVPDCRRRRKRPQQCRRADLLPQSKFICRSQSIHKCRLLRRILEARRAKMPLHDINYSPPTTGTAGVRERWSRGRSFSPCMRRQVKHTLSRVCKEMKTTIKKFGHNVYSTRLWTETPRPPSRFPNRTVQINQSKFISSITRVKCVGTLEARRRMPRHDINYSHLWHGQMESGKRDGFDNDSEAWFETVTQ